MDTGLRRAQALVELGRIADAEAELRRLLAGEPADAEALMMLAHLQLMDRRFAEALAAADSAVAAGPFAERAYRLRALALSGLGRHEPAVEAAARAVSLDPYSSIVLRCYAIVLHTAGQSGLAQEMAGRAVQLNPLDPDAHFRVGDIASDRGDRETARLAYEETLRLKPNHVAARHDLAILDFRRRRVLRALGGLLDAAAAAPDETVAAKNIVGVLAWCVGVLGSMELLCALFSTQLVEAGGVPSRLFAGVVNVLVAVVVGAFLVRMPRRLRRALPLLARRHRWLAAAPPA
ncbi:tetratricopeptide repeat protein [Fodinicola feengrottensis]|uniref:tetratricopeptide repeat protein n=1 Tax=Fodinicola feengrottensis TaxID=435914 RepID=UPI002441EDB0|nr:tetratricopeptide repeat protein [Fodinicola feengrottensis]